MKTINISKLINRDPNLSIVLPGPCNCHCKFCFWDRKQGLNRSLYLRRIKNYLEKLPGDFQQISITGGEPMLSPVLYEVLALIDKKDYPKVVLTTNGSKLWDVLKQESPQRSHFQCVVDHVNISRHHWDDKKNAQAFGVKLGVVPDSTMLRMIIPTLHHMGVDAGKDVTFNCVTNRTWTPEKHRTFIKFAKDIGADAVCFRHPHGTLKPTPVETAMWNTYPIERTNECPVCKTVIQRIDGLEVLWKASVSEPSKDAKGVFEAIIQPDGRLTADWVGKLEIDLDCDRATKKEEPMPRSNALQRAIMAADALGQALREMQQQEDEPIVFGPRPEHLRPRNGSSYDPPPAPQNEDRSSLHNAWHRPSHGTIEPEAPKQQTNPRRCMCPSQGQGYRYSGCGGGRGGC